jgi:hypothetical protein
VSEAAVAGQNGVAQLGYVPTIVDQFLVDQAPVDGTVTVTVADGGGQQIGELVAAVGGGIGP